MLELLINPKKAERKPWEMFLVGLFYGTLSVLLVSWIFSKDPVLAKHSGILVVTFTVMFSLPFMYYTIKLEEKRVSQRIGTLALLEEHRHALYAFLWLFLGFVISFAFWHIMMPDNHNFQAQIETYCLINRPANFEQCINQYGVKPVSAVSGNLTSSERLFLIFTNNMYVLLFTLVFSLIFGAGAIFILAWNASVIAAAIGIFTNSSLFTIPLGLLRFMIHGLPEIASYFIVALAGGMVSIAVIRHETGTQNFWKVLHDSINLMIFAVVVLFIAALIEVFVTPLLF